MPFLFLLIKMSENYFYNLLNKHIPENAVHYAYDLWDRYPFDFKVTKKRNSKYGDYRFNPKDKSHTITINGDMNSFAFLLTYLHEVAHLIAFMNYGRKIAPHGKEWKRTFQEVINPVLSNLVFPDDILNVLQRHMLNPKATSASDPHLSVCLRKYDNTLGMIHLGEVHIGSIFKFNTRVFKKEAKRRTRILCQEINSGRKYLISQIALVENLQSE